MTANFAQTTPDENLSPGWNVQGTGAAQSTSGKPGVGYAESGVVPANPSNALPNQASAGYPNPPGAMNVAGEASGSYSTQILENPGYASAGNNMLTTVTVLNAALATAGNQNPFGVAAVCNVLSGGTATTATVAPFTAAGVASAVFGSALALTASEGTDVPVPPAGWIKFAVNADVTSVVWTPIN